MFCQCDLLLIYLPYTHLAHYNNIRGTMFCQCDLPYNHLATNFSTLYSSSSL